MRPAVPVAVLALVVLSAGATTLPASGQAEGTVVGNPAIAVSTPENRLVPSERQTIGVGETMFVQGLTNRKPDHNTITVEVIDGPSVDQFDADSTDAWPLTGVWSVTLSTDGVEPGTDTLEADDGDNTDTVTVEVVAAGEDEGDDTNGGDTGNNSTSIAPLSLTPANLAS